MSRGRTRLRGGALAQQQARLLAAAITANPGKRLIGHRSAEGDHARLRGIPAIGRGVTGAIPGTAPEQEAPQRLSRRPHQFGGYDD